MANNLLDKASIILTPTAYDNGKALCVKPSDGSGDFQFSRNSAATRVNAQGLVENVQILSSNLVQNPSFSEQGAEEVSNGSFSQEGVQLVTNGDFANGFTNWVTYGNTSVLNGVATIGASGNSGIYQSILSQNKSYKVTINVTDYNGVGQAQVSNDLGQVLYTITGVGEQTFYFNHSITNLNLIIRGLSNALFSIDNVSVREVGQNWVLGTGITISENQANFTGNPNSFLTQSGVVTLNKTYKATFTISNYISGAIDINLGGSTRQGNISANGTYTFYITVPSGNILYFQEDFSSGFIGSITNISVKEVGQNWTLGTGWSIGDGVASCDGAANGRYLSQISNSTLVLGKTYKVNFDLIYTSGTILFMLASSNPLTNTSGNITTGGSKEFYITISTLSDQSIYFRSNSFIGSVTNISVIEITDDTNLPRINYEGFSYQDAFGSELVVNGDFANNSWWTFESGVSVSNNKANFNTALTNYGIYKTNLLTSNKSYQVQFEITNYTSGGVHFNIGGVVYGSYNSVGVKTLVVNSLSGTNVFGIQSNSGGAVLSIDNVSVKEVTGQSVVPESGCGSWLFEPQSTNLITQSETFSDASWVKLNTTITENNTTSPDGTLNSDKLTPSNTVASIFMYNQVTFNASNYTLSFFIKYDGRQYVQLLFGSNVSLEYSNFDLINKTVTYGNGNIEDYGNDWYKISLTANVTAATSEVYLWSIDNPLSLRASTSTGNGVDGYYIYGAQAEQQSYATSYIPTSGSTVTRNQDVCNNGGTGAGLINSTSGVLYFEGSYPITAVGSGNKVIGISDGTSSNRVVFAEVGNTGLAALITSQGVNSAYITGSLDNLSNFKAAISYKQNDFALWINGLKVATDTSGNTPIGLNEVAFDAGDGTKPFYGKTKAVAVWKEALSDQELADLTYPTPTFPTFTLDFNTIAEQFTFARGSEATYVDAQGLIQSTNVLGSEQITNGSFDTDSNWTKEVGWNISNGSLNASATTNQAYQLNTGIVTNKTYKVTYTISNYVSGSVRIELGSFNVSVGAERSANGTYTEYIVALGNDAILFDGIISFTGSIDNVSVKEYITATNTPRLDYSTGAEAFLLEPQSTNLYSYSEDFSNAAWNKSAATVVITSNVAPDGTTNNVYNLTGTNANLYTGGTAGVEYTVSVYAKSNGQGKDNFKLRLGNSTSSSITVTDEWVRYQFTATPTTTVFGLTVDSSPNNEWDILIWGAQLEQQSYATSYIPSEGSQTTRNQETCNNATPEINSEEGVLYAEISALNQTANVSQYITISDGTYNNRASILFSNGGTNTIRTFLRVGGVSQIDVSNAVSDVTDFNKIAFSYKENNFKIYLNGVLVSTDTSGSVWSADTITKLSFSEINTTAGAFYGNTKDVQVYTKALSDAELIKLTTI